MRLYPLLVLACTALVGCAGTPPKTSPADLMIRNVTIVDVEAGRLIPAQDVLVDAGRITAFGPTGRKGAVAEQVVEGGNGYLIPGLWDMHVHWYDEATLPIFLAHGVTGIRQMRGYPSMSASRARGLEGTVGSPRVYLASPLVDGPRPATPPAMKAVDVASARALVALAAGSSADFLKLYDQIPRDAYFALIEEAQRSNVRVEGHVPIAVSWQEAAERGVQRSAEHLHSMSIWTAHDSDALHQRWLAYHERLDYHAFDAALRQENAGILTDAYEHQDPQRQAVLLRTLADARMWQVPTCVLWRARGDSPETFLTDPRMRFAPEWMRDFWSSWWPGDAPEAVAADFAGNARRDAFCLDRVRAMHAAGVPLLAGSDTIMPGVFPGSSLHEELALMVEAGLSPLDALRTATTGPAAFMERDDIGRIAPGALADLVLLEADPLLDIANTMRIAGVAIGGVWLDAPALRVTLDHAAAVTAAPVVAAEMARILAADGLDAAMAYYEAQCPAPPTQADCTGWSVAWRVGGALGQHADTARMPEFLAWVERTFHSDSDALDGLASHLADRGDTIGALRVARRILELAPGDLKTLEFEASLRAAHLDRLSAVAALHPFEYPHAQRGEVVDQFHGVAVSDPYRWMEDLLSPELEIWIEAQNRLSMPRLTGDVLYTESIARLKSLADLYPTQEPGREAGGRTFFRAFLGEKIQLLMRSPDADEAQVLLDDTALGDGVALKTFMPSPDGRYVAYVVGPAGADWGEIRIHDVVENRTLSEALPNVRFAGPLDWTADGQGLVYRRFAPPQGGRREAPAEDPALYLHRIGNPLADDLRLYGLPEDRSDWSLSFGLHGSSQHLFIYLERGPWHDGNLGGSRAEVQLLDLDRSGHPLSDAAPRVLTEADAAYRVVHAEAGHAWVYTDQGAPRRQVVQMDLAQPAPEHWRTVVPEADGVLSHVAWFGGRLVVHSMENVHSVVRVFDAQGEQIREIPLPGTGVVQAMWGSGSSPRVALLYSGLLQAPVMLSHEIERGTTELGAGEPGAPDLSAFEVVQEWVTSKDGTRVPMFVASRRGLIRDGSHPTIIHGYGASSTSVLPFFREDAVAWLQMGGVYAIANLRGGGEFGDAWYEAAIREHKQTTFDDLIAASEHLIERGWTLPPRLAISGGSNGGLLVTATMLQRPDLFGAVLADVPVTDVLRRHLSGNGAQQIDQWGTPDDPAVFPAMRAYSPLHNVAPGACYPATLVTTSRDDERLPAWHAYKFTAALQAAQGCPSPILLYVRGSGGHGGGDLDGWIESVAQQFVFLTRQLKSAL